MPTTPTTESMLKAIRQSGLIDAELLRERIEKFGEEGFELDDPAKLLEKLVETGDLTTWQADKIKQGKNKGFFLGKYRLMSLLGRGGMSSVYLAEHVLMRRRCAIKVLPVKKVDESSYLGRFHREAQAVAALDHPNIVRAYDVDSDDGHGTTIHFLVMEYVDGRNLQSIVDEDGVCEFEKAIDYIRQAADGLAHAHDAGFVHRDIKPGNLLVDPKGVVKLLDLGLARYFNTQDETSLTIEHNEKVLGTADYLAPEQALNSHNVDSRADIYGLGCTLYFLLTGKPPFDKGTLAQKLLAHQSEQSPSILESRTDTPPSIQTILEKMMAKKADDRYQTAKELADELSDWLVDNGYEEMLDSRLQRRGSDSSRSIKANDSAVAVAADSTPDVAAEVAIETETTHEPLPPADVPTPAVDEGFGAFLAGLDAPSPPAPSEPDPVEVDTTDVAPDSESKTVPSESDEAPGDDESTTDEASESEQVETSPEPPVEELSESKEEPEPASTVEQIDEPDEAAPNFDFLNTDHSAPAEVAFTPSIQIEETKAGGVAEVVDQPESVEAAVEPTPPKPKKSASKSKSKKTDGSKPKNQYLIGIASVLVLGVFGAWAMGLFSGNPSEGENSPDKNNSTTTNDGDGTKGNSKTGLITGEIKVGAKGDFRKISEALTYLKKHGRDYSADALPKIQVASGEEFVDRIAIDNSDFTFPKGVKIICEGDRPALLKSDGTGPAISLVGVEGFQVSGLQVDANQSKVAVQISGYCTGLNLTGLQITGFTAVGIQADGVVGLPSNPVRIEKCVLRPASPSATGVIIADGSASPSDLQLVACRFLGAMGAGIRVTASSLNWLLIQQSIFSGTKTGVEITGQSPVFQELKIANNTFYQCGTGIRFESAPGPGSSGLGFYQNLFVEQKEAELKMASKEDRDALFKVLSHKNRGFHLNWTSRSAINSENEFDLFYNGGKKNATSISFASTEPKDSAFLKPQDASLKLNSDPNGTNLRFIGAVSP